jgi:uncharacterized protein HemY
MCCPRLARQTCGWGGSDRRNRCCAAPLNKTTFVPALNNLGVVLVERRQWGEAAHLFRAAFALDSGRSTEIRENLTLALANLENSGYTAENNDNFALVRRGNGRFLLLATP